ncbi:MAG: hypothetical protein OEV26_01810 [Gallionella sp.]|nr:hypothetical protein [Gallionella sp.]MDH4286142.1 hypothetical protein [Gallionella sp.]
MPDLTEFPLARERQNRINLRFPKGIDLFAGGRRIDRCKTQRKHEPLVIPKGVHRFNLIFYARLYRESR